MLKRTTSVEAPPPEFLRPAQACEQFGVGRTFLYTLARKGLLMAHRPSPRVTLYRRADIESVLASGASHVS